MRKFVLDVLSFTLLQVVVLAAAWWACPRDPDHYAAAATDKRRRISSAPGPRVILVGGSAVSFGTDSRVIEARGLTSVNMGHNVGLGLEFMLAQTAAHLREGDVVVVMPEHELLWREPTDASLFTLLEHDPASVRYLDAATCGRLTDGGLRWMGAKLRCALHELSSEARISYTRRSFDERGDFVQHRGRPRSSDAPLPLRWPTALDSSFDRAVERLDAFGRACERAGARCVLAMSPLRPQQLARGRAILEEVERRLRTEQRLPLLVRAEHAVFPPTSFFDAGPHLTEDAAAARTRRLLDALDLGRDPQQ